MKVGMKRISELSGYSIATVSNVLNNKKGIHQATREKILEIAREVGYIAESKISSIKLVVCKKHGQIVADTPFFSALIEGIEQECRARGFQMEICNLNWNEPDYQELVLQICSDPSTGILLLATELYDEDMEAFSECAAPILVLDSWYPRKSFSSVTINNRDSVELAVEYLIQKGHQKIGYIRSAIPIWNFNERRQGMQNALSYYGLSCSEEVTLTPTMDGAYRDMKVYLENVSKEMPSAFFADNDILALGAMKALIEKGFRIPEDISIIGFDDLPFCEISTPPLTTIKVDKQQMGKMAVKMLDEQILKGEYSPAFHLSMCTEFMERKSVCIKK